MVGITLAVLRVLRRVNMIRTLAKKLLLATAVVMFAASAQAQVWVQGSPGWNARAICAYRYATSTKRAGDPRWKQIARRGYIALACQCPRGRSLAGELG